MKFKAKKEVSCTKEGWEDFEIIPKGTVCETTIFDKIETITYKGKLVCDTDSQMAKDYFEQIS